MISADVVKIAEIALLAARILLAAVFMLAGATKLVDAVGTRKALRNFGLPSWLARPGMLLLPLAEFSVAVLLIPVNTVRLGAWGSLILLSVFLIAVGLAMAIGRKPDCHCFGQLHSAPIGWQTLVRNVVLAACAVWLVWGGARYPALDALGWFLSLTGNAFLIALVVVFFFVFAFLQIVSRARPKPMTVPVADHPSEDEGPDDGPKAAFTPQPLSTPRASIMEPSTSAEAKPPEATAPGPLGLGLALGTEAPEFELPSLTGEKQSLHSLRSRGRDVMLIFSSPFCESCNAVAKKLVKWMREMEGLPQIVLISRGKPEDNRAKLTDFDPSRVLLQRESEVSSAYDSIATPTAVLVGADGRIRSGLATGAAAIQELLTSSRKVEERKRINRQAPV
jgi:peroxiredoxin/uncharacterized membrane protein YphA (DoxX/SURF4 family)